MVTIDVLLIILLAVSILLPVALLVGILIYAWVKYGATPREAFRAGSNRWW